MAIDAGPWRDGGYLVATRGSTMPRRCMICGADVEVLRETAVLLPRNVRPNDGIGGIATGVHALLAGERFRVRHGRCRHHRVNWIRYLGLLAGLACVASMVGFAGSIMSRNGRFGLVDAILLVAFILSIAATIWAATWTSGFPKWTDGTPGSAALAKAIWQCCRSFLGGDGRKEVGGKIRAWHARMRA